MPERVSDAGSSPLTRGKPSARTRLSCASGLIPAHAGKTVRGRPMIPSLAAHPRSRGENPVAGECRARRDGSSPLTRGKHGSYLGQEWAWGLIPAHAGKTARGGEHASQRRAHPRSRGENPRCCHLRTVESGSSPLTRGKRTGMITSSDAARLIPAHAGKTLGCRRA